MGDTQIFELEQLGIRVFYDAPMAEMSEETSDRAFYIHKHSFYELHILLESGCTIRAGGALYAPEKDQFCLIAPGVNHTPKRNEDRFRRVCVSFEILPKPGKIGRWLQEQTRSRPVWLGSAKGMLETVEKLQAESDARGPFSDAYIQAQLTVLMLQLVRVMEPQKAAERSSPADLDKNRSILIDMFFNDNYYLPAGEEVLAQRLGVSRRQLDRILKKLYGKGYQEKVLEIRLEVACDLLQHSGKSIREISEGVGYSTPSNFTAFFKNAAGVTPTQYRRQHKG